MASSEKILIVESPISIDSGIFPLQSKLLEELDQYTGLFPIHKPNRISDVDNSNIDPLTPEYYPTTHIAVFNRINSILSLTVSEREEKHSFIFHPENIIINSRNSQRDRFTSDVCIRAETIATSILIAQAKNQQNVGNVGKLTEEYDLLVTKYTEKTTEQGNNNLLHTTAPTVAGSMAGEISRLSKDEIVLRIYNTKSNIINELLKQEPDNELLNLIKPHLAHMHPDNLVD